MWLSLQACQQLKILASSRGVTTRWKERMACVRQLHPESWGAGPGGSKKSIEAVNRC